MDPLGACCLTSLILRNIFACSLPFLASINRRGMNYGFTKAMLEMSLEERSDMAIPITMLASSIFSWFHLTFLLALTTAFLVTSSPNVLASFFFVPFVNE